MAENLEPIKSPENETLPLNSGEKAFAHQEKKTQKDLDTLRKVRPDAVEDYEKAILQVKEGHGKEMAALRIQAADEMNSVDKARLLWDSKFDEEMRRGLEGPGLNERIKDIVNRLIEGIANRNAPKNVPEGPLSAK